MSQHSADRSSSLEPSGRPDVPSPAVRPGENEIAPMAAAEPAAGNVGKEKADARWETAAAVALIEASCAAVVAAFMATSSIWLALIVAGVAVLIVSLAVWTASR